MIKLLIGADILMATTFIWRFPFLPEQIPLFYSKPWGEAQIADQWYIFLLPILMHVFFFFNNFLKKRYFSKSALFLRMFTVANAVLVIAFTGIFLKILFLVT